MTKQFMTYRTLVGLVWQADDCLIHANKLGYVLLYWLVVLPTSV